MLDRFKDAQWYIGGGDELNTIIYDASFLEGDGPDGHGMVCESAVIEDARLIAVAPTLLRIVKTLEGAWDCDPWDVSVLMDKAIDEAREAIAKVEGWLVCQDGQHRCFNTDQPCGCRCADCRDDTEPRCDVCNQLINTQGQCEDDPSHYQITDWEVRERLIEPSPPVSQRREIQGLG